MPRDLSTKSKNFVQTLVQSYELKVETLKGELKGALKEIDALKMEYAAN